ncbi:MAG TPA: pirin family protein [Kofleriaceae bacterium]|nr:pirin family protein [Kofleriaceae bacterium]
MIDVVIEGRPRDIGGFPVQRSLPSGVRRSVGPFIFVDHMGPAQLAPGHGMDVRPHPHIGLATLTYLIDGEIVHRDSLGSVQAIRPGDVNWMIAGAGVAHSERTAPEVRARGSRMLGLQTWIALPRDHEAMAPRFEHHPQHTLPTIERPGVTLRVVAGAAYGAVAPTSVLTPTLYVHAAMDPGATLAIDDTHAERAVYVIDGAIECDGRAFGPATMVVLQAGADAAICATTAANVMLLGGAPLDGLRHMWWNFVATDQARIEQAKADWKAGKFAKVIDDEIEFVPLPER